MTSRRAFLQGAAAAISAGSLSPARAAATGYVRVEKIDGVWWFVGPEGDRFVSLGVNHLEPHLWLAPYNKEATLDRYGADMVDANGRFNPSGEATRKWIERQVETCRDLGFNTFGKHTHASIPSALYRDEVYHVASLETAPLAGWQERKGEGPRPDPFSGEFERFVETRVRAACDLHKNSRKLLGYLYTDIPSWRLRQNGRTTYPWVEAIVGLGEHTAGKQRWIEHLRGRYNDAEACARAWGLPVSPAYGLSWERMARLVGWSEPADATRADTDRVSFLAVVAERWYGLHRELIAKYDPNHLILGDKNLIQNYDPFLVPALRKHVDVIVTQSYNRWADDAPLNRSIHERIGKPIVNGDGSHSYVQPNQQGRGAKGFRTGSKSFEEVAALYRETLEGMMRTPYMIGWHHCGYLEQWDEAERGDSPRNENGFLDPFERPHTIWTDVIREANSAAVRQHEAAT